MKGKWITYSAEELAWIEANATRPRAEALATFRTKFGRPEVTLSNYSALCKRKGWLTGKDGRFVKGQATWNKGRPCAEGEGGRHPNARATHFQKGQRQGVAVKLYKPIGTERMSKSGYLERKIHDGLPLQSRWRAVHLLNWAQVTGPLPKGHCLKGLDGDRLTLSGPDFAAGTARTQKIVWRRA